MHRAPEPLGRVAYFSRAGTKVGYGGRRRPTHGGGNTDRRRAQCATFWVNGHYVPPLSLVRCVSAVRYVFLRGCVLQTCFFAVSVRSRSQLVVSPFFLSPLCVAACRRIVASTARSVQSLLWSLYSREARLWKSCFRKLIPDDCKFNPTGPRPQGSGSVPPRPSLSVASCSRPASMHHTFLQFAFLPMPSLWIVYLH